MKLVLIIILSANKIYLFTNSFTLFIGYNFSQIWYIRSFFDDLSFYEVIMKTKILVLKTCWKKLQSGKNHVLYYFIVLIDRVEVPEQFKPGTISPKVGHFFL